MSNPHYYLSLTRVMVLVVIANTTHNMDDVPDIILITLQVSTHLIWKQPCIIVKDNGILFLVIRNKTLRCYIICPRSLG